MYDNISKTENVILPYYKPEELHEKNTLFNEAYSCHFSPSDKEDIVKAMHTYHEAFLDGCPEAGVNALQMICSTIAKAENENPGAPRVLQEQLQMYIDELIEVYNHPAGFYYEAIAMILRLFDTDDDEACVNEGLNLMEQLVAEENSFALAFAEIYNEKND